MRHQIKVLREQAWEEDINWPTVEAWLSNFDGQVRPKEEEQLYGLYLLSRFAYFGQRLMREMLRSAYRDHVRAPMLQDLRRSHPKTGLDALARQFHAHLKATRFVGLGNPSESGAHLLYYFRQVNYLPKANFADLSSEFVPERGGGAKLTYRQVHPSVRRLVFFDDLVGSGTQIRDYLSKHLEEIRHIDPDLELRCVVLFATTEGRKTLRELFGDKFSVVFDLDETFRCFGTKSRYFEKAPPWLSKQEAVALAEHYGKKIAPKMPLGFRNGQLLLAFAHNTPDNTLPIFWVDGSQPQTWHAAFKRFDKQYA